MNKQIILILLSWTERLKKNTNELQIIGYKDKAKSKNEIKGTKGLIA